MGQKKENNHSESPDIHIDFSLGDLFKGLGSFIDLASKMEQKNQQEITRTGKVDGPQGLKAVYGYSMKLGLGGKPSVSRFGNVREGAQGPIVEEAREPLTDIFDEKDSVVVVLEIPGVDESAIVVKPLKENLLMVEASGPNCLYRKEIALPSPIKPDSIRRSYRNGLLELNCEKQVKRNE